MPSIDKAERRERKKQNRRKMPVSGKGLLAPIDWEERVRKQRRRKRGKKI